MMTRQERLNFIDVSDYISMRMVGVSKLSNWERVRSLNLPNSKTPWAIMTELDDYDSRYEPTIEQCSYLKGRITHDRKSLSKKNV